MDNAPESVKKEWADFNKVSKDKNGTGAAPQMPDDLKKKIEKITGMPNGDYLKFSDEIIAMCETNEDAARRKYKKVFKYVDLVNGVVVSVGNHPAGCVVSPFPVDEWFGTFTTNTDEYPVSMLNMKEIDSLNFVKLDILGLDNIGLIYKTCEAAGIPFLTPDNTPADDIDVWNSIKDDTTMIFQWESQSATAYLKQLFSPQTVARIKERNPDFSYMDLLSLGNGAIRPAGASYRDQLAQGIYKDNGNDELNEFLKPTLGYCVEENQIVDTLDGPMKIKDVKEGQLVYTRGANSIVTNKVCNGKKPTLEIRTSMNSIICTKEHRIYTANGWVKAEDLNIGDYVCVVDKYMLGTCHKDFRKITSIEDAGARTVYDLSILGEHSFICQGIVVHNCTYQEQIIEFLHKFCGFTMGEADVVRRHFSKKTGTETDIPIIKDGGYINPTKKDHYIKGFIQTMKDDYGVERDEAEKIIASFLQVIIDASDYLFSKNHSDPYSWIGYICGYLRYYYPLEFISTALNIFEDKEDKQLAIIEYSKRRGIKISPIKFRHSIAKYSFDKESNQIFKGIASIKYMNNAVADEMYALKNCRYDSFVDLLDDLNKRTSLNSRQLKILIDLDFFEEFGEANYLLYVVNMYDEFGGKVQIKKDKLDKLGIPQKMIKPYAGRETEKMFTQINAKAFLKFLSNNPPGIKKRTLRERIDAQIEHLGYINIVDDRYSRMLVVVDIDTKYSPKLKCYSLKNGTTLDCKIDKRTFNKNKLKKKDVIMVTKQRLKPKSRKNDEGKWEEVPGTIEVWIEDYHKVDI